MSHHVRPLVRSVWARRFARGAVASLLTLGAALVAAAPAAALPAGCYHERHTAASQPDPRGLCVSYGYGTRPSNAYGAPSRNVVSWAEGRAAMPFDYYVRSDIAEGIARGTERPRATYLLLFGGAFICGSRADLANQARELAQRGYVAIVPEYPLSQSLSAYGYYNPNAPYSQATLTQRGSNSCNDFLSWTGTSAWQQGYLPRLYARGLEPALQQGQWVLQTLIRTLKRDPTYGADGRRIFALGVSAGGSMALRLAMAGNQDATPSGGDPGDSTIAGAFSLSGPLCYPGSASITAPMLFGKVDPARLPACSSPVDPADPPMVMIQEPGGGVDDPVVPDALMWGGCDWINRTGYAGGWGRRCIYEDRLPGQGGYIADGQHASPAWSSWLALFDTLGRSGVGAP